MNSEVEVIDVEFENVGKMHGAPVPTTSFPAIVMQPNADVAEFFSSVIAETATMQRQMAALVVRDAAGAEEAKGIGKDAKMLAKSVLERTKSTKDEINRAKDIVLSWEKHFVGPLEGIEREAKGKINAYLDEQERIRREEEARIRGQMEKERQQRMAALGKKLDALAEKAGDVAGQIAALEKELDDPGVTVETAEVIRSRINGLQAKLRTTQASMAEKEQRMDEAATPIGVVVQNPAAKVQGVGSRTEWVPVEVVNLRQVLQDVLDGRLPQGIVTINMQAVKKVKNTGLEVRGITFEQRRVTSLR